MADTLGRLIQFKQGDQIALPTLKVGEPGFTIDEKRFFIGSDNGNKEVLMSEKFLEEKNLLEQEISDLENNITSVELMFNKEPVANSVAQRMPTGELKITPGANTGMAVGLLYRGNATVPSGQRLTSTTTVENAGHVGYMVSVVVGLATNQSIMGTYLTHPNGAGRDVTPIIPLPSEYAVVTNADLTVSVVNNSASSKIISMSVIKLV